MKRVFLFVFLVLAMSSVWAQKITLEECRQMAREHYPLSRQYGLIDQSERYSLDNAARVWIPQVRLSAQATWQTDAIQFPDALATMLAAMGNDFQSMRQDQYKLAIDVTQSLWDGGYSAAEKGVAQAQAKADQIAVDVELFAVESRVDNLYFGILLLDAQKEQLEKQIEVLEENKRRCQVLAENELALASDVDAVEVELIKANQAMSQLNYTCDAYTQMLSLLIGQDLSGTELVMPDDVTVPLPVVAQPVYRPELRLFDAKIDYLDAQKRLCKTASMPQLAFFAQGWYGYPGLNMFENMMNSDWSLNAIVGVSASWRLTPLVTQRNTIGQLNVSQESLRLQRDVFDFNRQLQITQEDKEIDRLRQTLQDDERIVALRHSLREAAENKHENGIVSITEVLNAITEESMAQSAQTLHQIELIKKKYELNHIIRER